MEKKEEKKMIGYFLQSELGNLVIDDKEIRSGVSIGKEYSKGCSCGCFKTEYDLFVKVKNVPQEVKDSQYVITVEVPLEFVMNETETSFGFKSGAVVVGVEAFNSFKKRFQMSLID